MQVAGDGYSLLDRAVMEHNLISTARVYCNISLAELGAVLALDADRAEKVAAAMITEGRLRGIIDQTGERLSVVTL
jgi:COP9 signalosome complex subunit 4